MVAWNVVATDRVSPAERSRLSMEVDILARLRCDRLIRFYEAWTTETSLVFVTAIVNSGDLRKCVAVL
jgi:hypothetical protein